VDKQDRPKGRRGRKPRNTIKRDELMLPGQSEVERRWEAEQRQWEEEREREHHNERTDP
jgi:hypothetical protein